MAVDIVERDALNRLMTEVRPRLHRYCARMVGSVFDGEDIVQEALAKAAEALPSAGTITKAESWLFTIAHNTALDALRRRKRQAEVPLDGDSPDVPGSALKRIRGLRLPRASRRSCNCRCSSAPRWCY